MTTVWKGHLKLLSALTGIFVLLSIGTAGAAFTVVSTSDLGDDLLGDFVCRASQGAIIYGCTLRAALEKASHLGGSHTINLPAGTYYVGQSSEGHGLHVEDGTTVNIVGAGQASTFLDGGWAQHASILAVNGSATVSGVTVRNADHSFDGGAIYN